jgi:hypothetical protein
MLEAHRSSAGLYVKFQELGNLETERRGRVVHFYHLPREQLSKIDDMVENFADWCGLDLAGTKGNPHAQTALAVDVLLQTCIKQQDHFALIDIDFGSPSSLYGKRTDRVKQLKRAAEQRVKKTRIWKINWQRRLRSTILGWNNSRKRAEGSKILFRIRRRALNNATNEFISLNATIKSLQGGVFKVKIAGLNKEAADLKRLRDTKDPPAKSTFDLLDTKSLVFKDEIVHLVGEINKRLLEFFIRCMDFNKGTSQCKMGGEFLRLAR